jgi:SAM-dependent methyltransferase
MAELVGELSKAYNAGEKAGAHLPARLAFSFPRDVPKSSGAVRELVGSGALRFPEDRALRVLDLGAGLGASTWGVILALEAEASEARGRVDVVCSDQDQAALSVAAEIVEARRGVGASEVTMRTVRCDLSRGAGRVKDACSRGREGAFDVVLLGQVLSEIDAGSDAERLALHLELVRTALDMAAPEGSVVIVEPALCDRTRRLHALRDALLSGADAGVNVFAPCLHEEPCPALADPKAWCHEDLDVDLPGWLVPVAKAAGLRWQGLTFSYLVLRKDGRTLRHGRPSSEALVRVVSEAIVTKGKREAFVCGDLVSEGGLVTRRARAMRLDREASEDNAGWDQLARGDVLETLPPLDAGKPRVRRETRVRLATPSRDGRRS